jgi:hypothetical protein
MSEDKFYMAYNHFFTRPPGPGYIKIVSGLPPVVQTLDNPFLENTSPGFKRTSTGRKLYYVNGRNEVYLSNTIDFLSNKNSYLYHLYFNPDTGVLLDILTETPIIFKKVFYPQWPFVL